MNGNPPANPTGPADDGDAQPMLDEEVTLQEKLLHLAKRFLWCNPFYLASAALLLFGISRLTESPDFGDESTQMFFNFGSLQFYETLLVATAILLARRRVWYDSTLLVVLDSLFMLVPFILVSQAAFLGEDATWLVCATGGILVASRLVSLKVFYSNLNLPNPLLACSAVLLLVNIALPLVFKREHQLQPGIADRLSLHGWLWLMPVLMSLGNLLPRQSYRVRIAPERSGLPTGLHVIWVTVTGYHLFRLGYIYDLTWNVALLTPVLWVASWTLYRRLTNFVAEPGPRVRALALWQPAIVTSLAVFYGDSTMFFTLSALNAVIYGSMFLRDRENEVLFQLTLLSAVATLGGIPEEWGKLALPEFTRNKGIILAAGANALLQTMLSRIPQLGIFGGFVLGAGTVALFPEREAVWFLALQNALAFVLLHSLRWNDNEHDGASLIRIMVAVIWVGHAVFWVQHSDIRDAWPVVVYAMTTLIGYIVARLMQGHWGPILIPIASIATLMIIPARMGFDLIQKASVGLLALVASIVMFIVGTALAWTKDRWHKPTGTTATE